MIRLVRAELLKLRTTQVWFWMLLAAIAVTVLFTVGQLASHDGVRTYNDAVNALTASGITYIVVFVLGVLGVTTEFRYQTITPSVLVTPSRWSLVTAKIITYALVGAIYAVVCVVIELAIALPWISSKGIDISLTSPHMPRAILSVFGVVALFGIVGIGIGALLRNQIVAVTVGVIFLLILNNVIAAIPGVRVIFPYTPNGAVSAIFTITGDRTQDGFTLLPAGGAVVVLLLWAFIPAIVGAAFSMNRDIT